MLINLTSPNILTYLCSLSSISTAETKQANVNSPASESSTSHNCSLLAVDLKNFKASWNEQVFQNRERWKARAAKGELELVVSDWHTLYPSGITSSHHVVVKRESSTLWKMAANDLIKIARGIRNECVVVGENPCVLFLILKTTDFLELK